MGMHNRMRAMVIRQLALQPKGKGVAVTFKRKSGGGYDPSTGDTTPVVTTVYTTSGVRVNYSEYAYRNTTVQYGDFQIYVSPLLDDGTDTPRPVFGDEFTFLDEIVKVINVSPFNDNGLDCGWKVQVRHG